MKAVISTTYDDKYLFSLPIVTWCWNKLGVDVVCFMPFGEKEDIEKSRLVNDTIMANCPSKNNMQAYFIAPKHKEATYAQCSRLFASALDLPEEEILITSDADMALFELPSYINGFTITGSDLTPLKQYPICYLAANVKEWRSTFGINGKTYQECLDELLGGIEATEFRGNYWSKDQEHAYNCISVNPSVYHVARSNGITKFARNRCDRDDDYWKDDLKPTMIDAHLWRPGYDAINFEKIMYLLNKMYPNENFDWLKEYRENYIKLL